MTGRASVFADAETIKLINDHFIAVAADDWYQRRRTDVEGRFWKKVADQGPRKGQGGATRQGIYCFTPDGELLVYRNHLDENVMRDEFKRALKKWQTLPAARTKPGALTIEDAGAPDERYHRPPPRGGLILCSYTRILDKKDDGYVPGTCSRKGADFAALDHVWLTAEEWKSLIPANPKVGDTKSLPRELAMRLARFHLVDNTRGEPPHWQSDEVRELKFNLTVESVTDEKLVLAMEGATLLATESDAARSKRGYDVRLRGTIDYHRKAKQIAKWNMVAVGDHWGEGTYTGGARPGRTPLGIAFELADGKQEADRVPPQAARELTRYFHPER